MLNVVMLSVANELFMLNVIMLNVVAQIKMLHLFGGHFLGLLKFMKILYASLRLPVCLTLLHNSLQTSYIAESGIMLRSILPKTSHKFPKICKK
jgi:hypothetical protein